jgi:hypothetical protein
VYMGVYDPRHDIHPMRIDLARGVARSPVRVDGNARRSDTPNLGDDVSLNDDIDGPARRTSSPIDECCPPDNQSLKRSDSIVPHGRRWNAILRSGGGGGGNEEKRCGGESSQADRWESHGVYRRVDRQYPKKRGMRARGSGPSFSYGIVCPAVQESANFDDALPLQCPDQCPPWQERASNAGRVSANRQQGLETPREGRVRSGPHKNGFEGPGLTAGICFWQPREMLGHKRR